MKLLFRQGVEAGAADLHISAFALETDEAVGDGAFGDGVHAFAVDVGGDGGAGAEGFAGVPFADGFLSGFAVHDNGGVGVHAFVLFAFGAGHDEEVALMVVLALDLDAGGPDFIGRLHVDEDAGVVEFGGDFDEAPGDGEFVVGITRQRAEIADGLAGAMDDAVGDGPGGRGIAIGTHAGGPIGEVVAIEKFYVAVGDDDGGGIIGAKGGDGGAGGARDNSDKLFELFERCHGASVQKKGTGCK